MGKDDVFTVGASASPTIALEWSVVDVGTINTLYDKMTQIRVGIWQKHFALKRLVCCRDPGWARDWRECPCVYCVLKHCLRYNHQNKHTIFLDLLCGGTTVRTGYYIVIDCNSQNLLILRKIVILEKVSCLLTAWRLICNLILLLNTMPNICHMRQVERIAHNGKFSRCLGHNHRLGRF